MMVVSEVRAREMRCCVDIEGACVASDCMGWRWLVGPPTALKTAYYSETTDKDKRCGYCVRAGKPE